MVGAQNDPVSKCEMPPPPKKSINWDTPYCPALHSYSNRLYLLYNLYFMVQHMYCCVFSCFAEKEEPPKDKWHNASTKITDKVLSAQIITFFYSSCFLFYTVLDFKFAVQNVLQSITL